MNISKKYTKLKCITNMEQGDFETFNNLVNIYGNVLDKGMKKSNILYTLHDFSHHCFNIYRIISDIILQENAYDEKYGLSSEELFLLNVAVLFHDYSLASDIHVERNIHSKMSADGFLELWNNTLGQDDIISQKQADIIYMLILAHSDLKEKETVFETLNQPDLKDNLPGSETAEIRGKLLAGILRLADELDITSDRIGERRYSRQLDAAIPSERESKWHWDSLCCFKSLRYKENDKTVLELVVDDSYVQQNPQDFNEIAEQILSVSKKVHKEFKTIQKTIFNQVKGLVFIRMNEIEIYTNISKLNQQLESRRLKSIRKAADESLHPLPKEINLYDENYFIKIYDFKNVNLPMTPRKYKNTGTEAAIISILSDKGAEIGKIILEPDDEVHINTIGNQLVNIVPDLSIGKHHFIFRSKKESHYEMIKHLFADGRKTPFYNWENTYGISQFCADDGEGFVGIGEQKIYPFTKTDTIYRDLTRQKESLCHISIKGTIYLALTYSGKVVTNYYPAQGWDELIGVYLFRDYTAYGIKRDGSILSSNEINENEMNALSKGRKAIALSAYDNRYFIHYSDGTYALDSSTQNPLILVAGAYVCEKGTVFLDSGGSVFYKGRVIEDNVREVAVSNDYIVTRKNSREAFFYHI